MPIRPEEAPAPTRRGWAAMACLACAVIAGAAIAYRAAPWGAGWVGIVASAVIGGFFPTAILLGWQAVRGLPRGQMIAAAAGLALTAVAMAGGAAMLLMEPARQQALDMQFREVERQEPLVAALREAEPAAYARFRDRLASVMIRGGSMDDAARELRPALGEAVAARALVAEDGLLSRMQATTLRQAEALRPRRPDLCAALLLGRPMGSLVAHLGASHVRAEMAVIEEMLRAPPPASPPPVATQAEAAAVLGLALDNAARETGIAPERLALLAEGNGPDAEICSAMIAFLEALQAMPAPLAMPVYRYLMREARRGI